MLMVLRLGRERPLVITYGRSAPPKALSSYSSPGPVIRSPAAADC